MALFLIIVFGIYAVFVLVLLFGWARTTEISNIRSSVSRKISIVIPFRNEEANLDRLMDGLKSQIYSPEDFEVILVNDHSSDSYQEVLGKWVVASSNIRLIDLKDGRGKKSALTAGIAVSRGEIIVTTDADCHLPDHWLAEINQGFDHSSVKMLIGAVRMEASSLFGRMQVLEMASLVGVTGGTLGLGSPSMCNGANLSFLKSAFEEVGGYQGNETISSGDDEFLMRKFFARWKDGLRFLNSASSVATTSAQKDIPTFVEQRLRWAGKWRANRHGPTRIMALAVLFFHLVFIGSFLLVFAGLVSWRLFTLLWTSKLFVEAVFLISVTRFLSIRWRWSIFFLLQFVYSFYVVSIGFASQVVTPKWKGRTVESGV